MARKLSEAMIRALRYANEQDGRFTLSRYYDAQAGRSDAGRRAMVALWKRGYLACIVDNTGMRWTNDLYITQEGKDYLAAITESAESITP